MLIAPSQANISVATKTVRILESYSLEPGTSSDEEKEGVNGSIWCSGNELFVGAGVHSFKALLRHFICFTHLRELNYFRTSPI